MTRSYITLDETHIGSRFLHAFGRVWNLDSVMGYVQRRDVGKRVYLVDDILQVENDEQLHKRLTR